MTATTATIAPIDTETDLIGPGQIYPPLVCLQVWHETGSLLLSDSVEPERLEATIRAVLEGPRTILGVNVSYDMHVLRKAHPELEPLIEAKYKRGEVVDVSIFHDLLALGEWGALTWTPYNDAHRSRPGNSLDTLAKWYLGVDISSDKKDPDSWRLRYSSLRDIPVSEWPEKAVNYALSDVELLTPMWDEMVKRARKAGLLELVETASKRSASHYFLGFATDLGVRTDPKYVEKVTRMVDSELDLKNYPTLVACGIIEPPKPPSPYANGALDHQPDCKYEGSKKKGKDCGCPVKMKAGTKEVQKVALLRAFVHQLSRDQGLPVRLTDKGIELYEQITGTRKYTLPADDPLLDQYPKWVATSEEAYSLLDSENDPIMAEFSRRQETITLRTNFICRFHWDFIENNPGPSENSQTVNRVHFPFRALVSTGRTGSRKNDLFPSMNGQNVDPRIRGCFIADPDMMIVSTDYGAIDLHSVAWRCESLGIESKLMALYREGKDPHGYLASFGVNYLSSLLPELAATAPEEYDGSPESFAAMKKVDGKWYKLWRTLAKPWGLGCFGGMMARTLAKTIRAAHEDLHFVTTEIAKALIKIWKEAFPEATSYFNHIKTNMADPQFSTVDPDTGARKDRFRYTLPSGIVRRNVSWSEVCNAFGLQGPSADATTEMLIDVVSWARLPENRDHIQILDFIHDELLYQIRIGRDDLRLEVEKRMRESAERVLPGVPQVVESAGMLRWDKFAPEIYNEAGELTCPELEEKAA